MFGTLTRSRVLFSLCSCCEATQASPATQASSEDVWSRSPSLTVDKKTQQFRAGTAQNHLKAFGV